MAQITEYIEKLLNREDLTFEQSTALLDLIFAGDIPEIQIAAFLTAMRAKGPTSSELAGLAKSLRSHAVPVKVDIDNLVDTCGTGGSGTKTFNISTAAALVAAGAGVHIAKHGNRGITSACGSADVLAELGVNIQASADTVAKCIKQARIGFMFAPMFHPAMKYVQPIRKGLGFRTVFNLLGPLANPANAAAQVLGVADQSLMQMMAEALNLLGIKRAMIVHSAGMDEISINQITEIIEIKDGKLKNTQLDPKEFDFKPADLDKLKVSDAKASAYIIRAIFDGTETGSAKDIVLINAAAAIIAGKLEDNFTSALTTAENSITSGNAAECLKRLIETSNN